MAHGVYKGRRRAAGCSGGAGHMNPMVMQGEGMEAQKKIIGFCLD